MLASALNFAIGFFGYPFEGQYQQSITIESRGVRLVSMIIETFPEFYFFSSTIHSHLTRRKGLGSTSYT